MMCVNYPGPKDPLVVDGSRLSPLNQFPNFLPSFLTAHKGETGTFFFSGSSSFGLILPLLVFPLGQIFICAHLHPLLCSAWKIGDEEEGYNAKKLYCKMVNQLWSSGARMPVFKYRLCHFVTM